MLERIVVLISEPSVNWRERSDLKGDRPQGQILVDALQAVHKLFHCLNDPVRCRRREGCVGVDVDP